MDRPSEVVLAHYGVKGMKWGVRRENPGGGDNSGGSAPSRKERKAAKQLAKADKKWEEKGGLDTYFKVYNAAAEIANSRIDEFNNRPKYKGKDFTNDSPERRAYYDDYSKEFTKILNDTSKTMGLNPSGTKMLEFSWDINGGAPMPNAKVVEVDKVKHADFPVAKVKIKFKNGFVSGIEIVPDEGLKHGMSDVVLAHYGVKGMKWGVRRKSGSSSSSSSSSEKKESLVSRASKAASKAVDDRDNRIIEARKRIAISQHTANQAKANYRDVKTLEGRRSAGAKAAKVALRQARRNNRTTKFMNSDEAMMSTSKELTESMLKDIGRIAVQALLRS